MIKYICFMESRSYGGSYGIGDTEKEAWKNARSTLGEKPKSTKFKAVEVEEGRKLVVQALPTGINWWTEPVNGDPEV